MRTAVILNIVLLLFTSVLSGGMKEEIEEILHDNYGQSAEVTMNKLKIPSDVKNFIEQECRQRFFRDEIYWYKIKTEGGDQFTALLDNVYGKSLPITFLVVYDSQGNIKSSHIVKYREPYGYGVKSESWLNQFTGKNDSSGYKPGSDIEGVTGSTISVRSVSKGIKKLSLLYNAVKEKF